MAETVKQESVSQSVGLRQRGSLAKEREGKCWGAKWKEEVCGLQGDECYSETLINGRRWE